MASAASEEVLVELSTVEIRDSLELAVQNNSLKKGNFPHASVHLPFTFCITFVLIPVHVTLKMDAKEVAFL